MKKELTINYGVNSAPTLLVPSADGFEKIENASNIKRFVEEYNE